MNITILRCDAKELATLEPLPSLNVDPAPAPAVGMTRFDGAETIPYRRDDLRPTEGRPSSMKTVHHHSSPSRFADATKGWLPTMSRADAVNAILRHQPNAQLAGKSDTYIFARLDAIMGGDKDLGLTAAEVRKVLDDKDTFMSGTTRGDSPAAARAPRAYARGGYNLGGSTFTSGVADEARADHGFKAGVAAFNEWRDRQDAGERADAAQPADALSEAEAWQRSVDRLNESRPAKYLPGRPIDPATVR